MAKKIHIPQKLALWIEARKRHSLSHVHVQMARELGMNPKKLGKLANRDQEPWKRPLREYIEHLYVKRFGRDRPDNVRSIEQLLKDRNKKKEIRKKRKEENQNEEGHEEAKQVATAPEL
ncbi:MAG: hypothetical protein GY757_02515, partial [bacterium]|nr:hypothetical protein [bacterium]